MLTRLQPEDFDIANAYLQMGSSREVAEQYAMPEHKVVEILEKTEVKTYLNSVYLDQGYRNRDRLGKLMDRIIEKKLEEMEESEMGSNKDIAELIAMAHKMRMDEIKAAQKPGNVINVDANLGGGYGKLMNALTGAS